MGIVLSEVRPSTDQKVDARLTYPVRVIVSGNIWEEPLEIQNIYDDWNYSPNLFAKQNGYG